MASQQVLTDPDVAKHLQSQNRSLETIDPKEIKAAEEWASTKKSSWVKLPNANVDAATDGLTGTYTRDKYALWLRLSSNTEFGYPSFGEGESIPWYKILYSTVTDPRFTANAKVKWLHAIRDRVTGKLHVGLFSSPPNDVHDTVANAVYKSVEIKEQLQRIIKEKMASRNEVFDPVHGIFLP
ncbi:MAG: hypothetical protein H6Q86_3221 [candidate division NC10 bacterium]|jgi:hypothetical protein|nr:hypothetical protein [candidate division NC10 bacterium]